MSRTVDERVVEMRFDNKQFESGVQTSLSTLEKLKRGLDLDGAAKGFDQLSTVLSSVATNSADPESYVPACFHETSFISSALR